MKSSVRSKHIKVLNIEFRNCCPFLLLFSVFFQSTFYSYKMILLSWIKCPSKFIHSLKWLKFSLEWSSWLISIPSNNNKPTTNLTEISRLSLHRTRVAVRRTLYTCTWDRRTHFARSELLTTDWKVSTSVHPYYPLWEQAQGVTRKFETL